MTVTLKMAKIEQMLSMVNEVVKYKQKTDIPKIN